MWKFLFVNNCLDNAELGTWNLRISDSLASHSEKWIKTCPWGSGCWQTISYNPGTMKLRNFFLLSIYMILIHLFPWSCYQALHWLPFGQNLHTPLCMHDTQNRAYGQFLLLFPVAPFLELRKYQLIYPQGFSKHSKGILKGVFLVTLSLYLHPLSLVLLVSRWPLPGREPHTFRKPCGFGWLLYCWMLHTGLSPLPPGLFSLWDLALILTWLLTQQSTVIALLPHG